MLSHSSKSVFSMIRKKAKQDRINKLSSAASQAPTSYKADPIQGRKFRFQNTVTVPSVYTVTIGDLFRLYLGFPSSGGVYPAFASVKILRVQVWSQNVTTTAVFSAISLEWLSANAPSVELSRSGNQSHPAYLTTTPPEGSLAGFWYSITNSTLTTPLFQLQLNGSETVDIEVQYVPVSGPFDSGLTNTNLLTPEGAGIYYGPLSATSTANRLQAVSNPFV